MIVSRRPEGLVIVRQVDHQEQCALMAAAWGNARFSRPAPFAPVTEAAGCHDEGWRAWEDAPQARDGAPVDFTEIDRPAHVAIYRECIRAARERGPRCGLLVSMHGRWLYEGWGGAGASAPRARHPPVVRTFLREQEGVRAELRREIGAGPELDAWASAAYRLVQAWDALSIHMTWRGLMAGRRLSLPHVPREAGDTGVELSVSPDGPMACTVSPWPFSDGEVALPVRARAIEDRRYSSDLDLGTSLARSSWLTLGFTLRPG